ncbi:MAG: biosynthetic peptidoglycan transglycosylase [Spirochaetia bacterium]|jgi:monofunctional biosynthetic peptidoglycan transglycosylase|nr:biosynthetic peptidoglycan transglycosylase [Spirochaetia bacterium]
MITLLFTRALRRTTRVLRHTFDEKDTGSEAALAKPGCWFRLRQTVKSMALAVLVFHLWFIGTTSLLIVCFATIDPAATTLSVYRKHVDGWKVQRPIPTTLKKIPLNARRMLVSVEDYKYWEHHGIDMEAFSRALEINKRIGKTMYGGSTLTMQTARTLFLVPFKSYARKYLEVIVAFELELILSKERILELYFSWAEWGKGVFGIEAASMLYYGVPVAKLGAANTAALMAVLSSPIRYTPFTLSKSALLVSRYEFLAKRYVR